MQINKIQLQNFKFHHNLSFNLSKKNCLIYGENGTGKSSIYEGLYSNLYYYKDKKIINRQISIRDTYLNINHVEEMLSVSLALTNNEGAAKELTRTDDELQNHDLLLKSNIFMANEKVFNALTNPNFLRTLNETLSIHFPIQKLFNVSDCYSAVLSNLNKIKDGTRLEDSDIMKLKLECDQDFTEKFKNFFPIDLINQILHDDLRCDITIDYFIKNSNIDINLGSTAFTHPQIILTVNENTKLENLGLYYNEAKLKLLSIAIFFAFIKKFEIHESNFNLIILDDFLTSLDMSNRKKIIDFIINNFDKYQIFILTHNIQFFNLIKKIVSKDSWETKILFTIEENGQSTAHIKSKTEDYIQEAKNFINSKSYDLAIAGNLLRKAFEGIIHDFEQLLQLGKVEELQYIINSIRNHNTYFYNKPHNTLNESIQYVDNIVNNSRQPVDAKIKQIGDFIKKIKVDQIIFQNGENDLIIKTGFFKNILMNPGSHNDSERELYRDECKEVILLLETLETSLSKLK